jgi:hypothetical protein
LPRPPQRTAQNLKRLVLPWYGSPIASSGIATEASATVAERFTRPRTPLIWQSCIFSKANKKYVRQLGLTSLAKFGLRDRILPANIFRNRLPPRPPSSDSNDSSTLGYRLD